MRLRTRNAAIIALVASATVSTEVAKAAMVISTSVVPNVTVGNGTYDEVTFNLTGLTGADSALGFAGQEAQVILINAVFTATGSVGVPELGVPGDSTTGSRGNWTHYIDTTGNPPAGYDSSFTNFPNVIGEVRNGTGTSDGSNSHSPTMIAGNSISVGATWYVNPPPASPGADAGPDPVDNPFLATVLVTPGDGITLRGGYGTYGNGGNESQFAISYVPNVGVQATSKVIVSLGALEQGLGDPLNPGVGPHGGQFSPNSSSFLVPGSNGDNGPEFVNNINRRLGDTSDDLVVTGFTSNTNPEIFALKLLVGTSVPTAGQISTIISDINSANIGVTALQPTIGIASLFPGYELELTSNSTTLLGSIQDFEFNFAQETNVPGVVVTDIVGIPEPASIVGALAFSASLSLGRRRFVRAKR